MKNDGASPGSHAAHEAPEGLRPAGFDPARVIERLGYFDGPGTEPAFYPVEAACPICEEPMGHPEPSENRCRSFRVCDRRSWFFRYHQRCRELFGDVRLDAFEAMAVDAAFSFTGVQ